MQSLLRAHFLSMLSLPTVHLHLHSGSSIHRLGATWKMRHRAMTMTAPAGLRPASVEL
jgi:hypothetical protein